MPKVKLTEELIISRLKASNRPEISIDYSTYQNVDSPCRFIDSEYGEWWASASNVIGKNSSHPKRGHKKGGENKKLTLEEVKEKISQNYGDIVKIDELSYYQTNKDKVRFIDKDYGEFWQRLDVIVYGASCGHPKRGRESLVKSSRKDIEWVKNEIKKKWGSEIILKDETYIGINYTATFCQNGLEWESRPFLVIRGHGHPILGKAKAENTMLERYGVRKPTQHKPFLLKAAKNLNKSVKLSHWKTGEELSCTSSYEYAVVSELNKQQIDFDWQIPFDLIIDNKSYVYYIDLYLKDRNIYVEIKGFFRDGNLSQKKWEIFHEKYKNSEIWFLDEVKKFVNLNENRIYKQFKNLINEDTL